MDVRVTKSLGKFCCGLAADWSGLLEHIDEARRTPDELAARPAFMRAGSEEFVERGRELTAELGSPPPLPTRPRLSVCSASD
jgi:hypothetical protein